jgi:hypothetical protein
MSGRATFGDFARSARRQLAAGPPGLADGRPAAERTMQVPETISHLSRVVVVLERCCSDIAAVLAPAPRRRAPDPLRGWPRASVEAQDAIRNAAGYLALARGDTAYGGRPHVARRADGAWTRPWSRWPLLVIC